jgi:hypothetical protein
MNRRSNIPLESKGVNVNTPQGGKHARTLDDMTDHVIETSDVPKFRDSGVARQEQPLSFLLRDDKRLSDPQVCVFWGSVWLG